MFMTVDKKLCRRLLVTCGVFLSAAFCMAQESIIPCIAVSVSENDAQSIPYHAIDGDAATYWEMPLKQDETLFTVDLGSDVPVSKVELTVASATATPKISLSVFGMDAAASDFAMLSPQITRSLKADANKIAITMSATVRFIQVRFSGGSGSGTVRVHEFLVYGASGAETNSIPNTR